MNIVVVGATGGIGQALIDRISEIPRVHSVFACSRERPSSLPKKARWLHVDLVDEPSIRNAANEARCDQGLDLVIVATGILHDGNDLQPEKTWRTLDAAAFHRAFSINTVGPALVGKHFLPLLGTGRKTVFAALSARVGSISDNRAGGWHSYRASKAALNMILKNFAIELEHRNPTAICVGLHPGTVETRLSQPFRTNVPAEKLFSPDRSAAPLIAVLEAAEKRHSGTLIAWDGQQISP